MDNTKIINEFELDNTKIIIKSPIQTLEEKRKSLIELYDVCNEIFKDKPELFYTKEEINEIKKDKASCFI